MARAVAHAPVDDQPLTAEGIKALNESQEWAQHNPSIPHEQVMAELGITLEEIDRYNKAR